MNKKLKQTIITLSIILVLCNPASADVAFPTIAWILPPAWLLLIPVILLEAQIGAKKYAFSARDAFKTSCISNISSTIFGVPIAWLIFALVPDFVTEHTNNLPASIASAILALPFWITDGYWIGQLSMFLGLLFFFLLSVWFEYLIAVKILKNIKKGQIKKWAWTANAASYLLLSVFVYTLPRIKTYTPFAIRVADFIMSIPKALGI